MNAVRITQGMPPVKHYFSSIKTQQGHIGFPSQFQQKTTTGQMCQD